MTQEASNLKEQLLALLSGLETPSPAWWLSQSPESLYALGKSIANQAKQNKEEEI